MFDTLGSAKKIVVQFAASNIIALLSTLAISSHAMAGGVYESPAIAKISAKAAVISELEVNRTQGGINPDYFAYIVKGRVEIGTNNCDASGRKVNLATKQVGEDLVVFAEIKKSRNEAGRICSMEYAPVFVTVEATVRGMRSQIDQVLILNVDREGSHESINP